MKKLISLISLAVISLNIISCKITQEGLWGVDTYKEEFTGFTISEGGDVILIGKKYHYALNNSEVLKKIIDSPIALKVEILPNGLLEVDPSSKKIEFDLRVVSIKYDLLSNSEREFFKKLKFSDPQDNSSLYNYKVFYKSLDLIGTREIVVQKDGHLIHPLNLAKPFKKDVVEERTPLKTTSKILLTPFAVAADILMIPLYIIGLGGMIAAE
jgi:hypothetical protein